MSRLLSAGLLLSLVVSTSVIAGGSNTHLMQKVVQSVKSTGKLPPGFTKKSVEKPALHGTTLSKRFDELTREKVKDWKNLISSSGEYEYLSDEKRLLALSDPAKFLEVPYLIEVLDVFAVYRGEKLVGYVFETSDHVQAAIYQDGAGIDFYTDEKLDVVAELEWSA